MIELGPLFELSRQMIAHLARDYRRTLPGPPLGKARCCLVTGQRGVGKTTWMVRYLLDQHPDVVTSRQCLYLPADHFLAAQFPLYQVAKTFAQEGGRLLCVDEIHKAENWARDLKSALDTFPTLAVVATGSSLLHLQHGTHDLSRRVTVRSMQGLSFREFLELKHGMKFTPVSLEEILSKHETLARNIVRTLEQNGLFVLGEFHRYLEYGFYPYFLEIEELETFYLTLQQGVRTTLESDLPALHPTLSGASVRRIHRLLAAIAAQVPFTPDLSKLRRLLPIADDRTLKEYLRYLEDAGVIQVLRRVGGGLRSMEKPDRIYLGDANLAHALAMPGAADSGSVRETFFVRAVGIHHDVRAGQGADFLVDGQTQIEVGGKSKTGRQIIGKQRAYLALDDIPSGSGVRTPLWLFGFLS